MMNEWIISSSILIVAVLLGREVLRGRISLRLQYALWLIVLVRLLLPVQLFTSDFGAGSIARDVDVAEPVRQVYASAREDDYERAYDAAYARVVAEYESRNQAYAPAAVEQQAAEAARESIELDMTKLLYTIWFAGMGVLAAVIIGCNLHFALQLRRSRRAVPEPGSLLPVYVTGAVPTPCLFGIFRPAVYLTQEAASDERVRAHVLSHELTHYRHWDHIWSVLRTVCLILHWYNPLVWLAVKVSRADAELACDEGTLAKLGEEHRADYGRTLIGLTCGERPGSAFLTATTMTGSARTITERIRLLMKRPRNTVLALTALILVGTIIVGCTFAGAPETTEPAEQDPVQFEQDGLIVFPGTEWNMTEEELLTALDIQEYGTFSGMRGFHIPEMTVFGYTAEVGFYFEQYTDDTAWGLSGVMVRFQNEEDADAVRQLIIDELGRADRWTNGVAFEVWCSDLRIEDLVSPDAYAKFREDTQTSLFFDGEASSVSWFGPGNPNYENTIIFESYLPTALQIEAAIAPEYDAAYFSELLNPQLERSEADWYPRALTSYYDSPAGIDLFQLFYNGIPGADNTPTAEELAFLETQSAYEPDFGLVRIPASEMDRVLTTYFGTTLAETAQIGMGNFMYDPDADCYYHCHTDTNLGFCAFLAAEELANGNWRVRYATDLGEANVTLRQRDGSWQIVSNLPVETTPIDPTAEVAALFAPDGDTWYRSALTVLYPSMYEFDAEAFFRTGSTAVALTEQEQAVIADAYGKEALEKPIFRMTSGRMDSILQQYIGIAVWDVDLSAFLYCPATDAYLMVKEEITEPPQPEIVSCEVLTEEQVRMIYTLPGSEQLYCAVLLRGESSWKVYSNQLLVTAPADARALTGEEIERVNKAFAVIDETDPESSFSNPLANMTNDFYADVTQMDRSEFLRNFPYEKVGTEEDFRLLKEKYPADFENEESLQDMPVPIHRYDPAVLDETLLRYAGIRWEDLRWDSDLHYLEETGCYYNYVSDFGIRGFHCTGGWVYDGGAVLVSGSSALYLTERGGDYFIQAHLPAIAAE